MLSLLDKEVWFSVYLINHSLCLFSRDYFSSIIFCKRSSAWRFLS